MVADLPIPAGCAAETFAKQPGPTMRCDPSTPALVGPLGCGGSPVRWTVEVCKAPLPTEDNPGSQDGDLTCSGTARRKSWSP